MAFETLLYDVDGAAAVVRLNRPDRMNAVTERMYRDLQAALDRALADPAVRAIVVTGSVRRRPEGDKPAFSAGADLKEHAAGTRTKGQRRAYIELAHETVRRIHECELPVIAAVNGPARGAGAELAVACDFVLVAETATIGFPEATLGTCVGGGASRTLPRLVGEAQAKRLLFTGAVLDGPAAVERGLALSCHPAGELLGAARALAEELAAAAPVSLRLLKELVREAPGRSLPEVLDAETEAILACMETKDWHEGLASFAEKRRPAWRGR